MTDDDDIIKQTTKLLVVGNTLQRKFSYCSREVKMELFRSHCYSIYCNSLWSRYKVATMNHLKVCHNDILKRLLGLPRWCSSSLAFARNGVNNLDVIRRHSVFRDTGEAAQPEQCVLGDVAWLACVAGVAVTRCFAVLVPGLWGGWGRATPVLVYPGCWNGELWLERSAGIGDWHQLPQRVSVGDCEGGVVTVVSLAEQMCGDAQASLMAQPGGVIAVCRVAAVTGVAHPDDERTKG
ncbi:hypothetical protein GWK47_041741 [Chionoecetes opilio]|uniref:Uncharacterized protein n=1 Tax=Chionoecetes opilio TaxID=41210 RepID=A0A8J5CZB3_CHIOP|nr:hypothetical protein GWK47_041741 [Chionoecetes opilio]